MPATALTATDRLLKRNAELSKDLGAKSFTLTPDLHALVLTCADHRVDPAQVLGLELGEAVVLRNPGGRVTPAFISELAVLATVAQIEGLETGFELILMHHTDCGLARLDGPEQRGRWRTTSASTRTRWRPSTSPTPSSQYGQTWSSCAQTR